MYFLARNDEFNVHVAVCTWLKVQHPQVIFRSDLGGIRLTINQARKAKALQHSRAYPDLFVAEPRCGYNGLFIEIKAESDDLFNKNGTFLKSERLFEQAKMMEELEKRRYYCDFKVGFDLTKDLIREYLICSAHPDRRIYKQYISDLNDWYYDRLPKLRLRV